MQNMSIPEDTSLQEAFYRAAKDAKEMKNLPITQLDTGRQFYIVKEFGHRALIDYGRLSTIYFAANPETKTMSGASQYVFIIKNRISLPYFYNIIIENSSQIFETLSAAEKYCDENSMLPYYGYSAIHH